MRVRPVVALLFAIVLVGAACGREEQQLAAPSPTPAVQSPDTGPEPGQPRCETQTGGDRDAAMHLQNVTVEAHPGFDRVVFELVAAQGQQAAVPFWEISPADPPLREPGTGDEIMVAGESHLSIILWASGVELRPDEVRTIYDGPQQITPDDTEQLVELRQAGDYENVNTWYAGTRSEACFVVTTESEPLRIVLDIHA